ncbi:MAG: 30S ribosomal protein S6, partial [Endomicrobiia bacterium]
MKNFYEIITIFAPNIEEEKLQGYIKKIKSIISSCDGNIINEENWGNKKLAYEIKKFNSGIYHFIFC